MKVALAVLALALAATIPAGAASAGREEAVERRVDRIATELRCPVCQNLSVKDSPSDVAAAFRARVRQLVLAGKSDTEVRQFFVARYGDWILLRPPRHGIGLAVWLLPPLLLGAGLLTAVVAVRRWTLRARRLAEAAAAQPEALAEARARLDALEREKVAS